MTFIGWTIAEDVSRSGDPAAIPDTPEEIEKWWKVGKTLPEETTAKYPLYELNVKNDTGINVLVDMSHQCDFFHLWWLAGQLNQRGLRAVSSHATLDTVIVPGSPCRIRIPVDKGVLPYAWWPACEFNVVLTEGAVDYQGYLPSERKLLQQFIRDGGGLVVSGALVKDRQAQDQWSLNKLLKYFGASVQPGTQKYNNLTIPVIDVDANWQVMLRGDSNAPVYARREYGKGRVVLLGSSALYRYDPRNAEEIKAKADFLADVIKWSAAGKEPVGGTKRLPIPMGGGGGILPDQELRIGGMVVYYTSNQFPELLKTVREDFPAITRQLYEWLPSPVPTEPMNMILCSGNGGGWAVNAYKPREVSTIATNPAHVRGIFAHEQAHTMSGPFKAAGNHALGGNQGDHHAGWFQGKILAMWDETYGPNRDCQLVFKDDYDGSQDSPDAIFKQANLKGWRAGHDYLMTWYIWQKLDDRYGPTWYPRWRWVQQQRWAHQPDKKLTLEETIEDISIAVAEDLFPFIIKTGRDLAYDRFEKVTFMGKQMNLPVAPIEPTPPGDVRLEAIGDYTKPIKINTGPGAKLSISSKGKETESEAPAGGDEDCAAPTLDSLMRKLRQNEEVSDDEINKVVSLLTSGTASVSAEEVLPKLRLLRRSAKALMPTKDDPIKKEAALERLILSLENRHAMEQFPDETKMHPAAEVFPGSVAKDAKRVTCQVTINPNPPGWHNHGIYSDATKPYWHSTGLYAPPGESVTVALPEDMVNKGLHIRIGAHSDLLWHSNIWLRMPEISRRFAVCTSRLHIANAFGGLIYIESPCDMDEEAFEVTIAGAVKAPHFVLGKTDPELWRTCIRNNPAPWAELETDKIILTLPSDDVRKLDDPVELMTFWDEILDHFADLMGLDTARRRPERFVCDVQISMGYMHSGYPLMTWLDITSAIVDKQRIISNGHKGVWGLFHELGHNHQRLEWTFPGTTEVTCNLFSLYLMEKICGIGVNGHPSINALQTPDKITEYLAGKDRFTTWKQQPFLALNMYMQMIEEFGWEPFTVVFTEYRNLRRQEKPKTDDERRDQWLVRFSRAVGKDLGAFFEVWGIPTSDRARASIADLPDWMPEGFPPEPIVKLQKMFLREQIAASFAPPASTPCSTASFSIRQKLSRTLDESTS